MAVPLEKFVQQLQDTGIVAGETLKDFIPPKGTSKDAEDLARQLVKHKKLTRYQAEEAYKGRARSLILGNYILMERIGAGGMGQVFKAHHRQMDRFVAIKLLPPAMTQDKDAIARFEREIKAAAKISHPNIVAAHDAGCDNGVHFLVTELIMGSDLSALVKKQGPISIGKAIHYTQQAAKGLEAAHKKGVIHRDIKPANLILSNEGIVKILDMGLARLSGEIDASTHIELTSTGAIMGTVDYMAPEQAVSTKNADGRADIYSLGCSLYFLLTGKSAYEGDTLMARMLAHRDQPIPSLRSLITDAPEELDTVFRKMVAKRVEDRYQTMTLLISDLEKCNHCYDQTLVRPARKNTASRIDELSFLNSTSALPKTRTLTRRQTVKTPARSDRNKFLLGGGLLGVLALLAGIVVLLRTSDGTLIVEVNQPGSMVQVLDETGQVEVSQTGGSGKVTLSVDPGKHRLKVVKEGYTVYGQEFVMEKNGTEEIKARLEPLGAKPGRVEAQPSQPVPATVAVPVTVAKKTLYFETPEFAKWAKDVGDMRAEMQVKIVSQKLVELNPGFDGRVTDWSGGEVKIENGVVTNFGCITDNVVDISPVRVFRGLKALNLSGSGSGKGRLSDLAPLKGMLLSQISLDYTAVEDLSPLEGMKLHALNCNAANRIRDLSPLRGMPMDTLNLSSTSVSDISPLAGMPLHSLGLSKLTFLTDLSPLKGMPLLQLGCYETQVTDFSPLKGMPLVEFHASGVHMTDFTVLNGMPLKLLGGTFLRQGRDIEPLRTITSLETINWSPAAEFWKRVDERQVWLKPIKTFHDPGFQKWEQDVAVMTAEEQVKAVSQKLMELNSGFPGQVTPQIRNGVLWSLEFSTDLVNDISPVRAIKGLKNLSCEGGWVDNGKLFDLSPLQGLQLTHFSCRNTNVSDLSPLKGMPLTSLNLQNAPVSDLTPLQGMQLTSLHCDGCEISDLSPLKGMPIAFAQMSTNNLADLSPLKGMPITSLNLDNTLVADISPLKGMPLKSLNLANGYVKDLAPLIGMKLTSLNIAMTRVSDLSPLEGMPLEHLVLFDVKRQIVTNVTDHTPLRALPLQDLVLNFLPERDSSVLRSIKTLQAINGKTSAEFWAGSGAAP